VSRTTIGRGWRGGSPVGWVHLVGGGAADLQEGLIFFQMLKSRRTNESRGAAL